MLRRQFVIPPEVAKAFVRDMKAFFKAKEQVKRDDIAAATGSMLNQHLPDRIKLRPSHVKALFLWMRDHT